MGIELGTAMAIAGGTSLVSTAMQSRAQSRATDAAIQAQLAAPRVGLQTYQTLERYLDGAPEITPDMYEAAKYYELEGGDYDRLERSIYERETGMWETDFRDALRMVDEEMAQRGFSSTIDDAARYRLASKLAENLRLGAEHATQTRYALEQQALTGRSAWSQAEATRRTAFNLAPIDIWMNRARLGTSAISGAQTTGSNIAGTIMSGAEAQNAMWGDLLTSGGNMLSSYMMWDALKS